MLKSWDALPQEMKQEEVKKYYRHLSKKRGALVVKHVEDISWHFNLKVFILIYSYYP